MRRFRAILAQENVETSEGWLTREFPSGCFDWRPLPLTMRGVVEDQGAHFGAFPLGRMDTIERVTPYIVATGVLDDEGEGADADRRRDIIRQIETRQINGISVDPGAVDVEEIVEATDEEGFPTAIRLRFTRYQIGAATVVAIPALEGTLIELLDDSTDVAGATPTEALDAVAAAASETVLPPAEWFDDPHLPELQRIPTVLEDGRVFGHLEGWNDCHLNFQSYCQTPWRSPTGYAYFHVCDIETTEGSLAVGPLAVTGGHFPSVGASARDWRGAQAHYDDPSTCVAYVRVGEDEHGKWFAGVLRAGVTPEQVSMFRSHRLSTDHRRIGGEMELVGANSVNVPGFVREIAMTASADGELQPLAAVVSAPLTSTCCDSCAAGRAHTPASGAPSTVINTFIGGDIAALQAEVAALRSTVGLAMEVVGDDVRARLRQRLAGAA